MHWKPLSTPSEIRRDFETVAADYAEIAGALQATTNIGTWAQKSCVAT